MQLIEFFILTKASHSSGSTLSMQFLLQSKNRLSSSLKHENWPNNIYPNKPDFTIYYGKTWVYNTAEIELAKRTKSRRLPSKVIMWIRGTVQRMAHSRATPILKLTLVLYICLCDIFFFKKILRFCNHLLEHNVRKPIFGFAPKRWLKSASVLTQSDQRAPCPHKVTLLSKKCPVKILIRLR